MTEAATTTKLRRACANCPWRIDAPRGYWDPQHFVDIWRNCQDDGLNIMLCHLTKKAESRRRSERDAVPVSTRTPVSDASEDSHECTHKTTSSPQPSVKSTSTSSPLPCQGWIRVMGFDAIGVRLLVMRGQVTFEEVEDKEGPKLFPTFAAMMKANKIPLPRRSKMVPVQTRLRPRKPGAPR